MMHKTLEDKHVCNAPNSREMNSGCWKQCKEPLLSDRLFGLGSGVGFQSHFESLLLLLNVSFASSRFHPKQHMPATPHALPGNKWGGRVEHVVLYVFSGVRPASAPKHPKDPGTALLVPVPFNWFFLTILSLQMGFVVEVLPSLSSCPFIPLSPGLLVVLRRLKKRFPEGIFLRYSRAAEIQRVPEKTSPRMSPIYSSPTILNIRHSPWEW